MDLRDFRSHEREAVELGDSLTVIAGPNGSGKTNLLEALHFGLTGRSCRTSMDRQVIKWDSSTALVEIDWEADGLTHKLKTALNRSGDKKIQIDDSTLEQALPSTKRPPVIVFLPDRLNLVTGAPGERRKHFDKVLSELDSSYARLRTSYNEALIQRNALLGRIRATGESSASLEAWNLKLAQAGSEVVIKREDLATSLNERLSEIASSLGLDGTLELRHRASGSNRAEDYVEELREKLESDLDRGFTSYGPHRADFVFWRAGHDIKTTGSQGEKRMSLLALLLRERELLSDRTGVTPVLLLDDVMSELDATRRQQLVSHVSQKGQCVITATEFEHVPVEGLDGVVSIPVGAK